MDEIIARIEALEAAVFGPPEPDYGVPRFDDVAGGVPDGMEVLDGFTIIRNVSGTTLHHPLSAFPGHPDQWGHLWETVRHITPPWAQQPEDPGEPDPDPPTEPDPEFEPWDPLRSYSPPATVTHNGRVYDLTHTYASPGWEPGDPTMHAVWKARTP